MSAKRILSAFIVFLCLVFLATQGLCQSVAQKPDTVLKVLKELGEVHPDTTYNDTTYTIYIETKREASPKEDTVFIEHTSKDKDTVRYNVLSMTKKLWVRFGRPGGVGSLAPGEMDSLPLSYSESVLSQLQEHDFYDTFLVDFSATAPDSGDTSVNFVDTDTIFVRLKIKPTLTEKMAGWISKASNTTIDVIYFVFLGLFSTWVYFGLRNTYSLRKAKFIGKDVSKLMRDIIEGIISDVKKVTDEFKADVEKLMDKLPDKEKSDVQELANKIKGDVKKLMDLGKSTDLEKLDENKTTNLEKLLTDDQKRDIVELMDEIKGDVKKLTDQIEGDEEIEKLMNKINSATKVSKELYLNMLKKGGATSQLVICLRNAAAECQLYESFDNHSESVGKRIRDTTEEAPSLSYFQLSANIAPSIGFFGTLIGMSHLLMGRAITAGASSEFGHYISYFSSGLLQAIVTSIIGLFLLVLSMGATFGFSKKAESIRDEMFDLAEKIMKKVKL